MLVQQASPGPGTSGANHDIRRNNASPIFTSKPTGSPISSDGSTKLGGTSRFGPSSPKLGSHSPKFGLNSPRLGSNSPKLSPKLSPYNSPKFGRGSPKIGRTALEDEAALQKVQSELKEGWSVHIGRDGRLYYCNHITRTASWLPPAESWCGERGDLPFGWEKALDSHDVPYYINHVNKTTTYVVPEGSSAESPPAPREVVLERDAQVGFGFVAGSERPVLVRFVTDNSPSVGKLEPGDQILCVNGEDVSLAAREHVISAVRACDEKVTLRVCQPARSGTAARRSALLSATKRAKLRARPPRVRFADSVQLNGSPLYPPSAFSLGDLCLPPMANVLKVFLENGQTKSFKYDSTTTVADVVSSLKDKLCIVASDHFSLVVEHVKSLRRNKLTLLDPKESLARIASRPGSHKMRCLFRVVFMPTSSEDLARQDPVALDYMYVQCCNDVTQERFAPELRPDVAMQLAALHIHQHALANNMQPAKLTVKLVEREFGLERFLPCGLLENMKRKELCRMLAQGMKTLSQSDKPLTQLQAKIKYLDTIGGLPSYGAKCFGSSRPDRVLLVSPRHGLSQIIGTDSAVPQPLASVEEIEGIIVRRSAGGSSEASIHLARSRVLGLLMEERDAAEMSLVIAGYYRLATGQELNVELEREPITEDIAPPYLSQHNVVPAKWSYLHYDDADVSSKKHFAIFSMPPPYHLSPEHAKSTELSNHSSPLTGYSSESGSRNSDFETCTQNEEFRLFDPNDACYLDDGMGFDLQSIFSMELLEDALDNPKIVEAKNEEVLKRVVEMQQLVENSERYLTDNCNASNEYGISMISDELIGKETSVDNVESDNESSDKMSAVDDVPGILKHSDSLLLLTESINQNSPIVKFSNSNMEGLPALAKTEESEFLVDNFLTTGNNDVSYSESDNESTTPVSSPVYRHTSKPSNKEIRTSFGLHSPDILQENNHLNLEVFLDQLRERNNHTDKKFDNISTKISESVIDSKTELIDLTLIPPPQTPDELDSAVQVPELLSAVPPSFADENTVEGDVCVSNIKPNNIDDFIKYVTLKPPTVKITPTVELTPEEIMAYIIPPPPGSNSSTLDRTEAKYVNQSEISNNKNKSDNIVSNGEVIKGSLTVSEIRNIFTSKTLCEARNSLLLRDKHRSQSQAKIESPKTKHKHVTTEKQPNGNAHVIEYPTVERRSMFSCCSKDKNKSDESNDEAESVGSKIEKSDSIPDVCEIRPPPRRKSTDIKPPERPPKKSSTPVPRPRSNSYTNKEMPLLEIPANRFNTLNSANYKHTVYNELKPHPPQVPPRLETRALSPPPPLYLPPKRPPLPPVSGVDILRLKSQKPNRSPTKEPRLASVSPHFQRNLNAYRHLENETRLANEDFLLPRSQNYNSMTLQPRHVRSNSETTSTILRNNQTILSLCSPQMGKRFSNRPDLLNGAPANGQRVFSPTLDRKALRRDSEGSVTRKQNHVRFKEATSDDIPTPPSPPTVKFPDFPGGSNGRVTIESLLCKTEAAVDGLLQRLHQVSQKCSHQHAHGGGEDINEVKFQCACNELTSCAVTLVSTSRSLVGALGEGGSPPAVTALADCLTPLRRLADLAQALGRHTSSPLQTRNLVLRVIDVTAAFKNLAGSEMADILSDHKTKMQLNQNSSLLESQLAVRAECLANVLATLLRSLRVFSP